MPSQYKMRLHQRTLLRLLHIYVLALLGGSLGLLGAALLGKFHSGLDQELSGPLIVFLSVALVAFYEGYRRQRLFVPKLWVSVLLAALVAAVIASPINRLGSVSTDLMAAIAVGLYVASAMLALCVVDLSSRPRTVLYQISIAFVLGMLTGFVALHITGATMAPATVFLFGMGTSFCLATAYCLVPQYFEDASFCVIAASDPLCEAKFNNPELGYWTMTSEQRQLTIVDGSVDSVNDPSMIWIPEALVPRLAVIQRRDDRFEIVLHEENPDPARRGEVSLNGCPLSPGRAIRLFRGDVIKVGSVEIEAEVAGFRRATGPQSMSSMITVLVGLLAIIAPARADQSSFRGKLAINTLDWFACSTAKDSSGRFPVAELRLSADDVMNKTKNLAHISIREIPPGGVATQHSFAGSGDNAQAWQLNKPVFSVESATVSDATKLEKSKVKWVVALDVSGSMAWLPGRDNTPAPRGESRWELLHNSLLAQTMSRPNDDAAILPFECWHPKAEEIKELTFQKAEAAIVDYQEVSDISKFKAAWRPQKFGGIKIPLLPDASKRDTRLFASAVSIIDGLIERRQSSPMSFQFDLFTDGDNEPEACFQREAAASKAAESENCVPDPQNSAKLLCTNGLGLTAGSPQESEGSIKCAQLLQSVTKAQKIGGIGIRFVLANPQGTNKKAEQERSLRACIEKQFPQAGCDQSSFLQVCLPREIQDQKRAYKELVNEIHPPGKTVSFYVRPATQREELSNTKFEILFDGQALPILGPRTYGFIVKGDRTIPDLPLSEICNALSSSAVVGSPVSSSGLPLLPWYFYAAPAFFGAITALLVLRAYRRQQAANQRAVHYRPSQRADR